ncbi:Clp protease N-terminal domain-containing protein [Rhizohabitans arisaemae]|uniref:Clp protease N-terminal domain-containing protein n=1 Tax=Rhizohabitans arisaemae TaxID=2720610 RepID=UPI0024B05A93|nr:Clp protease N-terminal domain-containing protein [Rhizohabitans arisaemae]
MTALDGFTPRARHAVIHAGLLARETGHPALDDELLLLALAELRPFERPLPSFTVQADAVRTEIDHRARDRVLLSGLGIDLDEVRLRMAALAPRPVTAPWRLRRRRLLPLRVTLTGPGTALRLTGQARKAVEVAVWYDRGAPATGEGLLWGLLADGSNPSVSIMRRLGADLRRLARDIGFPTRNR